MARLSNAAGRDQPPPGQGDEARRGPGALAKPSRSTTANLSRAGLGTAVRCGGCCCGSAWAWGCSAPGMAQARFMGVYDYPFVSPLAATVAATPPANQAAPRSRRAQFARPVEVRYVDAVPGAPDPAGVLVLRPGHALYSVLKQPRPARPCSSSSAAPAPATIRPSRTGSRTCSTRPASMSSACPARPIRASSSPPRSTSVPGQLERDAQRSLPRHGHDRRRARRARSAIIGLLCRRLQPGRHACRLCERARRAGEALQLQEGRGDQPGGQPVQLGQSARPHGRRQPGSRTRRRSTQFIDHLFDQVVVALQRPAIRSTSPTPPSSTAPTRCWSRPSGSSSC